MQKEKLQKPSRIRDQHSTISIGPASSPTRIFQAPHEFRQTIQGKYIATAPREPGKSQTPLGLRKKSYRAWILGQAGTAGLNFASLI